MNSQQNLTTTGNRAQNIMQVLKTLLIADPRTEIAVFLSPTDRFDSAFVFAGCEANARPSGEIRPPSISGFQHLAPTNPGWRQSFLGRGAMKPTNFIPSPSRRNRPVTSPLVSQSPTDWQAGYAAALAGRPPHPAPAGLDALSDASGLVEGRAAKGRGHGHD